MDCPKCNNVMPADARFCPKCGAPIVTPAPAQRIGAIALDATEGRNVINIGTGSGAAAAAGDYCPICGTFNPPEKTFRCAHCGRAFLCQGHQDADTYWCSACAGKGEKPAARPRNAVAAPAQRPAAEPAAVPEAGATRVLEKAGIVLAYVPGGEFLMGSGEDDTGASSVEKPQHRVRLDGFWIGQTAVTNAQYQRFIQAGGYSKREYWTLEDWQWRETQGITQPAYWNEAKWNEPGSPVVGVSWYEAAAYAKWAGARLPTEAEWEYAARGGPKSRGYHYAGSDQAGEVAWYEANSEAKTHPVGQKKPNELGLYDMSGNVWEWCEDWYGGEFYRWSPPDNPPGPVSGEFRVLRGGSWGLNQGSLRCADRFRDYPDGRNVLVGFRVAE